MHTATFIESLLLLCQVIALWRGLALQSHLLVGRAHYNKPQWDHHQFMPVTFHLAADSRKQALHPLDGDSPHHHPQLIIRQHWHGNKHATYPGGPYVCSIQPSNSSNSHPWRLSGIYSMIPILTSLNISSITRNMTLIAWKFFYKFIFLNKKCFYPTWHFDRSMSHLLRSREMHPHAS